MPYEWNWSQDVEKCTLDLVLSSFTHTNAIHTIAMASKGGLKFLPEPLPGESWEIKSSPCFSYIYTAEFFSAENTEKFLEING